MQFKPNFNFNFLGMIFKFTPNLINFLVQNNASAAKKVLSKDNANSPSRDAMPLHYAVLFCPTMIEELLKNGADPNVTERIFGMTPLHYACLLGRIEAVNLLLAAGGYPDLPNKLNHVAMQYAIWFSHSSLVIALLKAKASLSLAKKLSNNETIARFAQFEAGERIQPLSEQEQFKQFLSLNPNLFYAMHNSIIYNLFSFFQYVGNSISLRALREIEFAITNGVFFYYNANRQIKLAESDFSDTIIFDDLGAPTLSIFKSVSGRLIIKAYQEELLDNDLFQLVPFLAPNATISQKAKNMLNNNITLQNKVQQLIQQLRNQELARSRKTLLALQQQKKKTAIHI